MTLTISDTASSAGVVRAWFDAMQRGSHGELVALFAEDASYTDPFSGRPLTVRGREAIAAHLASSLNQSPPDLTLTVDRIDVLGEGRVRAAWTCDSPVFEAPVSGTDDYEIQGGLIQRLETRLGG